MLRFLKKEARLSASPLSFLFLAFSLMTFLPGYPILCGAFFICLGLFYSYQQLRESEDILYSVLLPVRKRDVVRAKYLFALAIELTGFLLCTIFTVIRQTLLPNVPVYVENQMMNANAMYLGFVLMIFAAFNLFMIGGFFKTAYRIGVPFLRFSITAFLLITVGESLHHFPNLKNCNATSGCSAFQLGVLLLGVIVFFTSFFLSLRNSEKRFETIDL